MDYQSLRATAQRLIDENGQDVTLTRSTGGVFDHGAGEYTTPQTVTQVATRGVVLDYPTGLIDGTRVLTGDRRALLIPSVEIMDTDALTFADGTKYRIVRLERVAPAGTTLYYEAQVRV